MKAWRELLVAVLLIAGVIVGMGQAVHHDFVNFDDTLYVTSNFDVQGGLCLEGIAWALADARRADMWHPLTWISLQADAEMFGMNAWGFHLTNLVYHTLNAVLVFFLFRVTTGEVWKSAWVAAFFALHPLHVESVAWIAERKDVLSTHYYLITLLLYVYYDRQPRPLRYCLVLLAFAFALMAKPMAVTVPCTMLLMDYWPLRRYERVRWWRLILEKIPLLVLSGLVSLVTLHAMSAKGVLRPEVPMVERVRITAWAYFTYLQKAVWPTGLTPFYPNAPGTPDALALTLAVCLLAAISAAVLWFRPSRPYLLMGWCWYLGILFPVTGMVKFGSFAYADRFTYLPLVGIFVMLVWTLGRWRWSPLLFAGALAACLVLTRQQVVIWQNSETLWTHTLAHTGPNYLANFNLGEHYLRSGRLDDALVYFDRAVTIEPHQTRTYVMLARTYEHLGRFADAVEQWRKAVELEPESEILRQYMELSRQRVP